MLISPWKILGGATLSVSLLLAPLSATGFCKDREARRAARLERRAERAAAAEKAAEEKAAAEAEKAAAAEAEKAAAAEQKAAALAQKKAETVTTSSVAKSARVQQAVVQQSTPPALFQPARPMQAASYHASQPAPVYSQPSSGYTEYVEGDANCDESNLTLCERMRLASARLKCWQLNHCPCWCGKKSNAADEFCDENGDGRNDTRWQRFSNRWNFVHTATYPADPSYIDPRDVQVYSAQGYGVPVSVPLAPVVRYTYNDGWGVPASRITTVGSTYQRYYPQEFYGFNQQKRPAPLGADGRPQVSQSHPTIYLPTDTTQRGVYYKHVPQWQPAQRTRWSNLGPTLGVATPQNPTVNLTPLQTQPSQPLPQPVPVPAAGVKG